MKAVLVYVFLLIVLVGLMVGLGWFGAANNFLLYSFWAPKYADAQRKVFENTAPYNEGMAQDLYRMKEEYTLASKDSKNALRVQILQQFADYDTTKLPPDLQTFMYQLRSQ